MGIAAKIRGKAVYGYVQALSGMQSGNAVLPTYNDCVIKRSETTLTAAQLKALNTTPISIVDAPGSGKANVVVEIFATHTFLTTSFAGSNNLEFRYTTSNGSKVTADINASFLLATATAYRSVKGVVTELTPVANAPICAFVPTADPTQGLGSVKVQVYYRTITV